MGRHVQKKKEKQENKGKRDFESEMENLSVCLVVLKCEKMN